MTRNVFFTHDPIKDRNVEVGVLLENGDFIMERNRKKHLFRNFDAYGIQDDVYMKLLESNWKRTFLREIDTGSVFSSSREIWLDHANKPMEWGHGPQHFLSLKWWTHLTKNE